MKVLILCHADLVPPPGFRRMSKAQIDNKKWRTEGFVARALLALGHRVEFCGLFDRLSSLRQHLADFRPDAVFNLLEEFDGEALFEPMLVSYLKWLGHPVTGGSPDDLLLTKNKLATKCLLRKRKVLTPGAAGWPKIVKYVAEESSRGITDRGIAASPNELRRARLSLRRKLKARIFAEKFIAGRELHCGVIFRNRRLILSDLLETDFGNKPGQRILTERAKWDFSYRRRFGIKLKPAKAVSAETKRAVRRLAKETARALGLRGPARIDLRLDAQNRIYVIEVNVNPDLAEGDEFAKSFVGLEFSYNKLIAAVLASAF